MAQRLPAISKPRHTLRLPPPPANYNSNNNTPTTYTHCCRRHPNTTHCYPPCIYQKLHAVKGLSEAKAEKLLEAARKVTSVGDWQTGTDCMLRVRPGAVREDGGVGLLQRRSRVVRGAAICNAHHGCYLTFGQSNQHVHTASPLITIS